MCAIAGLIGVAYNENILDAMAKTMARRGPDSNGIAVYPGVALLHSRLAIVDPAGGAQPMLLNWAGECYTIVYNGELYNTREVRDKLKRLGHRFQTRSDTEVVLHAYAQWQEMCLVELNGIFGFAVWEEQEKRLFLARDRMGVKPLFYACVGDGLVFSSEIKTILASKAITPRLDTDGVAQLVLLGPGRAPGSGVFRDIRELEPGWYGYFKAGKWQIRQYWRLQDRRHTESFEETAENVRFLVKDAIERQAVCDVPMGTFLSGGLDSSIISAVCAQTSGAPLQTFSVDYENNERYFVPGKFQPNADGEYIRLMQQYLHSEHHWTVLKPWQLSDALEEATIARDLPGMADVDFSLLIFCRQIREYVKMALSGECADEIFGGYPWYRDPSIREQEGFPWAQNTALRSSLLAPGLRDKINGRDFVMGHYENTISQCDILQDAEPIERRMKEMVNLNIRWFMQTLLDRKDRMSMACGLEVRVPFCDYRIAEYLYAVPWHYKDWQGREKGLLRCAMRDILPEAVVNRKKSPYPKTWDPAYGVLMKQRLTALLQKKNAPVFELLDRNAVEKLLQNEASAPWYGQLMGAPQTVAYILQMDFWLNHYKIDLQLPA